MGNSNTHPETEYWEVYEEDEQTDESFLTSILDDCGKDCEDFLDVKCPHCLKIFNLGKYPNGCPHCGFN